MPSGGNNAPKVHQVPAGLLGAGLPIWLPSGTGPLVETLQCWTDAEKTLDRAERNRLLYVAMTRAADELYVTGTRPKGRKLPEGCWWNTITAALGEPTDDLPRRVIGAVNQNSAPETQMQPAATVLPAWLHEKVSVERAAKRQTVTGGTHATGSYDAAASRHGRAVHRLLEELAESTPEARASVAQRRSQRLGVPLDEAIALAGALDQQSLQPFLGPGSSAEVEISGELPDGTETAGRLDRLAITPGGLWLLDYKTDRFAPESLSPAHPYAQQMAEYVALLAVAYPGRPITAALFWTGPKRLQILSEALLRAALQES
jgi:ATP-dependent helicase/nuclease subunit A